MRSTTATGVLAIVLAGCDSGSIECGSAPAIPGTWTTATLYLSCASTDLQSVTASPPCDVEGVDASSITATGTFQLTSPTPGTCHVTFAFANGVTYGVDVPFTEQTMNVASCNGAAMSESFVGPPQAEVPVANPPSTCLDGSAPAAEAGLEAGARANAAADSGEAGGSEGGSANPEGGADGG